MPFISDQQLARVQSAMATSAGRVSTIQKRAKEKAEEALTVVEMVGGAAAIGFVRGKMEDSTTGAWNIPGTTIDIELATGLGLVGAAFFDVFKRYDKHMLNVGGGMLAHYTGQVFRKFGRTGDFALVAGGGRAQLIGRHGRVGSANDALRSALSAV